jgi:RimJ/RimL family protein N-acetyltransferase
MTAAFDAPLDIARVRITMDVANLTSAGVLRRLGYHLDGELQSGIRTPGQSGRGYLWTVTREQWSAQKGFRPSQVRRGEDH